MLKRITLSAFGAAIGLFASAQAPYTPNVTLTIDSEEALSEWTVHNANNHTYQFVYSAEQGGAYCAENTKAAADDWLITPAVNLQGGAAYAITVYAKKVSTYSSDKIKFSVNVGQGTAIADLSVKLGEETSYTSTFFKENKYNFSPSADGEYNIGIKCFTAAYNGGFCVQYVKIEKLMPYPAAATAVTAEIDPEDYHNVVVSWTYPTADNNGGTLATVTGAEIHRGTSSTFATSASTLVATYEDSAATPGGTGTFTDTTVATPGKYYYKVLPTNENGVSPKSATAVQSPWVGDDTSLASVGSLTATLAEDSDKAVTISFTRPAGSNGGHVDYADVAYKITRLRYTSSTATTTDKEFDIFAPEDTEAETVSFTDDTIDHLDKYCWQVNTVFKGSTSFSSVKSNAVVTGGAVQLPYKQDFANSSSIDLWTLFCVSPATRNWSTSSGALYYWGSPADAWAVTPALELKKGSAYQVSFTTKVNKSTSPKNLTVLVGDNPVAEAFTKEIHKETVTNTYYEKRTAVFSVDTDGRYYVAFHCDGASDSNDLYVDDLAIEEIKVISNPVGNLEAKAAGFGALSVNITFTAPAGTNSGAELETVDRIEILCGETNVATLEDIAGGEAVSVSHAVNAPGFYTYTVVPYIGDEAGSHAEATTGWVGPDAPAAPQTVTVEMTDEGRVIAADGIVGVHDGYIDREAVTYTFRRNETVICQELSEPTFTDVELDLPLAKYVYGVAVTYSGNTSEFTDAEGIVLGDALALPYTPDFTDASTFDLWTSSTNASGTNHWKHNVSTSKGTYTMDCSSSNAWLLTPPMVIKEGTAKITHKATCFSYRYPETFDIYLLDGGNGDEEGINVALLADGDDAPTHGLGKPIVSKIDNITTESANYPGEVESVFEVPSTGKYHIAFHLPTSAMTLSLHQADIVQLTSGIVAVETETSGRIEVYTIDGQRVYLSDKATVGEATGNLTAGLYIVRVSNEGNKATKTYKIIKR